MAGLSELGQVLHEEHFRILVAICELENRIAGEQADRPLDGSDAEDQRLLINILAILDQVIAHHSFEETVIFPLIRDHGEADLARLLTGEHGAIEPKARLLRTLARALVGRSADADEWARFRGAASDLVGEVMRHLEKEELTVVQRLPRFLDASTDHQLALRHGAEQHRHNGGEGENVAIVRRAHAAAARAATARSGAAARAAARRRSTTPPSRAGI